MFSSTMSPGNNNQWRLHADGRRRLYRRRGERFADACIFERDRYGGGSVMVLGGVSHGVKSPLIVVPGNLKDKIQR